MKTGYTADIGLEVHAELQTNSKMFCSCPVLDSTQAVPNTAVCPVCAGMPGSLPVVNQQAVLAALRVALSLECSVLDTSQFARKNYFYPDLPKGYQISQFEFPLAVEGRLPIRTDEGWMDVRIRRVHLEEDTAKLTHIHDPNGESYSLVDLNRAGIPLLEIVSEPEMHTIDQVRAYTRSLRTLLQYLEVNSGDLEKGVIRFEANVSLRPTGSPDLGTRVEIKNLNSFRTMTTAIAYELERQRELLDAGSAVRQETLGWDEEKQVTLSQRSKEEAHDYRYFPEPDLPPLVITPGMMLEARNNLPERPDRRFMRYIADFGLDAYQADLLTGEKAVADYYEETLTSMTEPDPALGANWILGDLFGWMNLSGKPITEILVSPNSLSGLLNCLQNGEINTATAKSVLNDMLQTGKEAGEIIHDENLEQISDQDNLEKLVMNVLNAHPEELSAYKNGKVGLYHWFFGMVMQESGGRADPIIVRKLLDEKLNM